MDITDITGETPDTTRAAGAVLDGDDEASRAAKADDAEILRIARERFKLAEEAYREIHQEALEDLKFRAGDQWPEQYKQERASAGQPCLTINRIPQFVQAVTNDQRQNRPAIKAHPIGDGADMDTARIIQGLIRHIEYRSNAETAYDTAFEGAATGGFGFFRIVPEYAEAESFEQEITIKRIRNSFSVYLDPSSEEPDGSDAAWGFITNDLSPDDFKEEFPDAELSKAGADWETFGNNTPDWIRADFVRVAEYFYIEMQPVRIHLLKTGETVRDEDLAVRQEAAAAAGLDASPVKSRVTKIPVVRWLKINGAEILERTHCPGRFIPIIPVYGNELFVDGKRILEGVTRHARDPQRMYNYWASSETETIALAPRAPYIGAEGQFEGYEEKWATANRRSHAYLEYKVTTLTGQPAPGPPQRQAFEPPVQAISQARMLAAEDMKATTGIYDDAVGKQSNAESGIAIQRRNTQAQTSNFHFMDNLTRSLRHAGRILLDWIPSVYDTDRAIRIIHDDGEQKMVRVNGPHQDEKSGETVNYDLTKGRYDVQVDTGPSFASKRQEAAASMMDFSKSVPQVAQFCGDLIAKNMDWPGAQEISDRIKRTLPPGLTDDGAASQIPPQAQAQIAQMRQMLQSLSKELDEATKVIETKQLDLQSRERIEILKLQTEAEIQMAKLGSNESIKLLEAKLTEMEHRLRFLQMDEPIEAPGNFNPENADGGNYLGIGHIGGTENLTGGSNPGQSMEGTP